MICYSNKKILPNYKKDPACVFGYVFPLKGKTTGRNVAIQP